MAEERRDAPFPNEAQQPTDPFQKLRFMVLGGDDAVMDKVCGTILGEREKIDDFEFGILQLRKAQVCGRQVSVLKTPSYWLKHLKSYYIFSNAVRSIKNDMQYFQSQLFPGPHALLLVLRDLSNSRKEHYLFDALREVFGKEVLDYCMVLFVNEDTQRDPRKNMCLNMCGNKYHILQNTDESVNHLFRKIEKMTPWKSNSFFTDHLEFFRKAESYFQEEHNDKCEERTDKLRTALAENKATAETLTQKIKVLKEQNAKKVKELNERTKELNDLKDRENEFKDDQEKLQKEVERLKDIENRFFYLAEVKEVDDKVEVKEKGLHEREKEPDSKVKNLNDRQSNSGSSEPSQSTAETPPAVSEDKESLQDKEEEEQT